MTRTVSASVLSSVLVLVPAPGWCAASLERYVLAIGANLGGTNRPPLLYAVSDAERFARVMIDIGGVAPPNEILLKQPKLHEVWAALDTLTRRVADARKRKARSRRERRSSMGRGLRSTRGSLVPSRWSPRGAAATRHVTPLLDAIGSRCASVHGAFRDRLFPFAS